MTDFFLAPVARQDNRRLEEVQKNARVRNTAAKGLTRQKRDMVKALKTFTY